VGDKIEGKLMQPLKSEDGSTIAPAGALIHGDRGAHAASRSRAEEDRASVKLAFTSVETVAGEKTLAATVTNVESLKAGSTTKRDALVIAGSAAAGAILGKVAGHDTKDAMIGGLAGAVVGTGVVMAQKGHELEIPAGSRCRCARISRSRSSPGRRRFGRSRTEPKRSSRAQSRGGALHSRSSGSLFPASPRSDMPGWIS
jgi:hypothetical protein